MATKNVIVEREKQYISRLSKRKNNLQLKEKRRLAVLKELVNPESWNVNLTLVSRKTGIPISTVYDLQMLYLDRLELRIILMTELDAEKKMEVKK